MDIKVAVSKEIIEPGSRHEQFLDRLAKHNHAGAVASFTGTVKTTGQANQAVDKLILEHYPLMATNKLSSFVRTAAKQWQLHGIDLIHRHGELVPHEVIVHVQVAATNRQDAQQACDYLVERLKYDAPFWKKECGPTGEHWVTPVASNG